MLTGLLTLVARRYRRETEVRGGRGEQVGGRFTPPHRGRIREALHGYDADE